MVAKVARFTLSKSDVALTSPPTSVDACRRVGTRNFRFVLRLLQAYMEVKIKQLTEMTLDNPGCSVQFKSVAPTMILQFRWPMFFEYV